MRILNRIMGMALILTATLATQTRAEETFFQTERRQGERLYQFETCFTQMAPDGTRSPGNTFLLSLQVEAKPTGLLCTCKQFSLTPPDEQTFPLTALTGWTYTLRPDQMGISAKGEVFGIPHARFQGLQNKQGQPLGDNLAYLVYNAFIDFHSLMEVFARPTAEGKGIQHFRQPGDQITHAASHTKTPVGLGKAFELGSFFQNGEITLCWKGTAPVAGKDCALVAYDSGDSHFVMKMLPAPNVEMQVRGASHYFGDLYVNRATGWLEKADLREFVVSQVTHQGNAVAQDITERSIRLWQK